MTPYVTGFAPDGASATAVITSGGSRFTASLVVLSFGLWTAGMLVGSLGQQLRTCHQMLHWFGVDNEAAYAPERFPMFIWMHGDTQENYMYGFPVSAGSTGVKVATEQYSEATAHPALCAGTWQPASRLRCSRTMSRASCMAFGLVRCARRPGGRLDRQLGAVRLGPAGSGLTSGRAAPARHRIR